MTVSFEQATIKVEKEKEFAELKGAIERAFSPDKVEQFLKRLRRQDSGFGTSDAVLEKKFAGAGG